MTDLGSATAAEPARGGGGGSTRIAGAAVLITGLTVAARIAGFGRTFVFLRTVGNDGLANIYLVANTIPNIVFELLAGGALASLVVPLLAGAVAAGDRDRVNATTSALLTWVLSLLVPIAVLVAGLAGPIAGLLPVPPEAQAVAARMLRLFSPQLPLYGLGVVLTGVLQAHHRFAWPVIAPLLSSVTVIGAYLGYAALDGPRSGLGHLSPAGELTLSLGTTCGVVVLALCLLIPVSRLRLRLRPRYRFPGGEGGEVIRLGWAGAVTVGTQQLMVAVVIGLATDGPYTAVSTAQTVFLLPWAVLAVPLATAVYPTLAAAAALGDDDGYRAALSGAARSVLLLACLGAAGLAGLAVPVAHFLDVDTVAPGIVGFAPGLLGYALFALLSRALYARGATVAAATATAVGWAVAALAAVLLSAVADADRQVFVLALAHSIGMLTTGMLLVAAVRRHAGPAALAGLGRVTAAGIVAAVAAGLAGWAVVRMVSSVLWATPAGVASIPQGMLGGVTVVAVFAVVAASLGPRQARPLLAALGRRLVRRRAAPGDPAGPATSPAPTTEAVPDAKELP